MISRYRKIPPLHHLSKDVETRGDQVRVQTLTNHAFAPSQTTLYKLSVECQPTFGGCGLVKFPNYYWPGVKFAAWQP